MFNFHRKKNLVRCIYQETGYRVATENLMSNSRTFQDLFKFFPGLLHTNFQDFSRTFQEIPGLSRTFLRTPIYEDIK